MHAAAAAMVMAAHTNVHDLLFHSFQSAVVSFRQWQNLFALFAYKFKIRKHSLCRLEFIYTIRLALTKCTLARFSSKPIVSASVAIASNRSCLGAHTNQPIRPNQLYTTQTIHGRGKKKNQVHLINFSANRVASLRDEAFFPISLGCRSAFGVRHQFGLVI